VRLQFKKTKLSFKAHDGKENETVMYKNYKTNHV